MLCSTDARIGDGKMPFQITDGQGKFNGKTIVRETAIEA